MPLLKISLMLFIDQSIWELKKHQREEHLGKRISLILTLLLTLLSCFFFNLEREGTLQCILVYYSSTQSFVIIMLFVSFKTFF